MTVLRQGVAALAVMASAMPAFGQQDAATIGERLAKRADVARAIGLAPTLETWVVDQQIALCQIPAPPFKEQARGVAYRKAFEQLGLQRVRVDAVGNVIGERPGAGRGPHLVYSAHLDTVFPEGTPVKVTRDVATLRGPGISDDCRGLGVVLGVIRALRDASVQTPGRITFVGTVGEEGLGDLRGVKHLFGPDGLGQIDRFVSVDGAGLEITNGGVGSRRYRATFRGPGGHSYGAFGLPNPINAMGRAIAAIADLQVPASPKTTFNVGRVGGGTSVNSIPFEAWVEVDLRSEESGPLQALDAKVRAAVEAAVQAENTRWNHAQRITVDMKLVGDRPAGRTADTSDVVVAARSVLRALSLPVVLENSSTDANVAMARGIPAITIGGGGRGTGAHSLEESFDTTGGVDGTRQAILMAIALAQP
ncbi:MAG TPA: M20/M25/M40 family metallo-hydrolase [Luteitalea sp.]|nr:M20/M25/M40 family metallo-hydrolase [Luteitalea sp.]